MKVVCLDAGHITGANRSPCVFDYSEGTQMWLLHEMLGVALQEKFSDVQVNYTRNSPTQNLRPDGGEDVYERGLMGKGADLFLSLHSNASNNEHCDDINFVYVVCPYDGINNSANIGKFIADKVDDAMCETEAELGMPRTGTRQGSRGEWYGVMRGARDAGVPLYFIIEHGFHTNEGNAKALLDSQNLATIAALEAEMIGRILELTPREYIAGDVNGDGKLTPVDYAMLKRFLLGTYVLTEEQMKRADVDGDGHISTKDYAMLKRIILGTYNPFKMPDTKNAQIKYDKTEIC